MPALLFLLWLWVAGWGLGQEILRWLLGTQGQRALPSELHPLWSLALGWGALAYATLAMGLLGGLNPWMAGGLLGLGTLLALRAGWRAREALFLSRPRWRTMESLGLATILALLLLNLLYALSPPTANDWDDLTYHLAAPKVYLRHGRILPIPYDSHTHFPFTMEMLYTLALLFSSAGAAKAIHWSIHALAVGSLFLFGQRLGSRRLGLMAALIYATIPNAIWESGIAYIDLAQGWYQWLAVWGLMEYAGWLPRPMPSWERRRLPLPLGLLGGFALGIKMMALPAVAWVGLGLMGHGWRQRRWGEGGWGQALGSALLFGGLALAVGSPWYLKSYLWTGNPFFPFLHSLFPSPLWSEDRAEQYRMAQLAFGHGRSPMALLRLPWELTFAPAPFFDKGQPTLLAAIGPAFLAFLPFGLLPRKDEQEPARRWLGGTTLAWGLIWFLSMQYVRYLLPTLLVGSLVAAWGVEWALEHTGPLAKGISLLFGLTPLFGGSVALWLALDAAPVVLGWVPEHLYLRARLDSYPAWEFVNHFLPPKAKVLTLGEPRCYYSEREYLWGERGHSTLIPYEQFQTAEELLLFLRRDLGVTHILINLRYFPLLHGRGADVDLYRSAWEKGLLDLLYQTPDGKVWLLAFSSSARVPPSMGSG